MIRKDSELNIKELLLLKFLTINFFFQKISRAFKNGNFVNNVRHFLAPTLSKIRYLEHKMEAVHDIVLKKMR